MTAKEKQTQFIKEYLKPKLKENGFRTSGNNWWKPNDHFFQVLNLQNSQWNEKDSLEFCFNVGIAIKDQLEDKQNRKAAHFDLRIPFRERDLLPTKRQNQPYRRSGSLGYNIDSETRMDSFLEEFRIDFEDYILKALLDITSLEEAITFYDQNEVWKGTFEKYVSKYRSK